MVSEQWPVVEQHRDGNKGKNSIETAIRGKRRRVSLCAYDDDSVAPTGLGSFWCGLPRIAPLARLVLG